MKIAIKRAYEAPAAADGYRVLVDRLWPRGVKKEALAINEWCKDIAPSAELREWFGHDPAKFEEFKSRYRDELSKNSEPEALLKRASDNQILTLVYSAKDSAHNQAVVLRSYLEEIAKH